MNIGIDMRPFYTPFMGCGALYCEDLLRALFRNHTAHVFYLWTTGERRRKDLPTFEKYSNIKWVHTRISQGRLDFWIQSFGYPYIDDIIETQAMKDGHMAWTSQLDAVISFAPTCLPIERNCLKVQVIEHCSFLHFSKIYSDQTKKFHHPRKYSSELETTDLVFVPSKFVKADVLQTCKHAEDKKITVVGAGVLLDFTRDEEDEKTQDLLEKELFLQHKKKEEETLKKDVLPEKFFFVRGLEPHCGNIDQVMKAYKFFRARFGEESWEMVIEEAYEGDLKMISSYAGVHIIPPITAKERSGIFSSAQAFFYPALYDGDGVSIIESMRCECPVLCSRYGALPEVYRESALHFSPLSEYSMLRTMKKIFLMTPEKKKFFLKKASERASHSRFCWDDIAAHMMHRIAERIEEKEDEEDE